jgi:hypothetical protein
LHNVRVGWLTGKCPIRDEERTWIDESMAWFVGVFGSGPLAAPVILPTAEFFPDPYSGSRDDVRRELNRVCGYMGVDPARVALELYAEYEEPPEELPVVVVRQHGTAGQYEPAGGKSIVAIEAASARRPRSLIATIAHELGHVLLFGGRLIPPTRQDGEPLTDLLTVYLGMGIFTANAVLEHWRSASAPSPTSLGRWHTARQGYLTEPMYGYALARYARLRGEPKPAWAVHLDTNPRVHLKQSLRYLKAAPEL